MFKLLAYPPLCVCLHMQVPQWRAEDNLGVLSLRSISSIGPEICLSLPAQSQDYKVCYHPEALHGAGVGLGLHTCTVNALLTQPFPQLLASKFLFKFSI